LISDLERELGDMDEKRRREEEERRRRELELNSQKKIPENRKWYIPVKGNTCTQYHTL
jgi:hypothetical protein